LTIVAAGLRLAPGSEEEGPLCFDLDLRLRRPRFGNREDSPCLTSPPMVRPTELPAKLRKHRVPAP
jgi:hypothetical protein